MITVKTEEKCGSEVWETTGIEFKKDGSSGIFVELQEWAISKNDFLLCAYQARELNTERGIAEVNEILCEACGACAAACLSGAAQQKNFTDAQLLKMVEELLV